MLFNTPEFIIFLLLFLIIWFITPARFRKIELLIFSYYFAYALGGPATVFMMGAVTVFTYLFGLLSERHKHRKAVLIIYCTVLVILLIYGKYTGYLYNILDYVLKINVPRIPVIAVIGLSYYAFSAISYIADIYLGKDTADKSLLDVAVFLSFFAKIIAGPIERHHVFKKQLDKISEGSFDIERVKRGLLIIAFGFFKKIIIADRMGIVVDGVYSGLDDHKGFVLICCMVLYSLQIYYDFSGYSMIAYGIAYILNIKLIKNFDNPYFSASVTEFWKRWHISLTSWLKDYIYIPLGGNRKGKLRQYLNIMITFLVSGIWHGAGLSFIAWGAIHGMLQVIEKLVFKKRKLPRVLGVIVTFLAVSIAWIFFRADTLSDAIRFIKGMFCFNLNVLYDGTMLGFGIDIKDWIVLLISMIIAVTAEWMQYKGISLYERLQGHNIVIRWLTYYAIIGLLLVFGVYGPSFDMNNFIYFKF